MSITIYGIKSCSTIKKALTKLDELDVDYEFYDYKKQAITIEKVRHWCEQLGIDKVLNKRGTTWRKLSDEQKQQADDDKDFAMQLLVENSSMIKRPIVEGVFQGKELLLCGYDEAEWTQIFSNQSSR
ncbi:Spx/MgsR family RNA polymerase-binding regulatory protein [Psychrobacter sp. I-STPA10]|uniref:Spx/MgsR family RNA polymerase-binding regulatory protein n=1 Tax=Psychrobacter sp. I-STPA10 TaxID=2585769 RepID=UPI001E3FBBAB|nr:Spx/MgsR family RNA polymerase-binding regulatory protein [Psychrobacter sp. I-STPA10]